MITVTLAVFLQASLAAAGAETYADAHRETTETGKPMVVFVGTEWCSPCQEMKRSVLPEIRRKGLLRKVAFAIVNADHEGPLAQRLTGGGGVPQLVVFSHTSHGWVRRKLVGAQSVETVENFISEAVAKNDSAQKETAEDQEAEEPSATPEHTKVQSISAHRPASSDH